MGATRVSAVDAPASLTPPPASTPSTIFSTAASRWRLRARVSNSTLQRPSHTPATKHAAKASRSAGRAACATARTASPRLSVA